MSKKSKKKPHLKVSRRTIVTTVIVIVVLAVAAGAGILAQFLQKQAQQNNQGIEGNANDFKIAGGPPLPRAVTDSQNLAISGKTEEANKKIEDALTKNPSNDTKYELFIQEGINFQNASKNTEAMADYRKAEAIKQDFKVTRLIAALAEAMGNKPLAIEYYRKAISLIDPESPLKDADKQRLEAKLKELGA